MHELLQTHQPGSKEFAAGVIDNVAKYPFIHNDLRKTWMDQAGVKVDPSTVLRQKEQFGPDYSMSVRMDKDGSYLPTFTPKKEATVDPLRQASAVRGQIASTEAQLRNTNQIISNVEKTSPDWLGSTGIFTDPKGVQRLGFPNKTWQDSPLVTSAETARQMKDYQDALKQRESLTNGLPKLNEHLDSLLSGTAPTTPASDLPPVVAPPVVANPPAADTTAERPPLSDIFK